MNLTPQELLGLSTGQPIETGPTRPSRRPMLWLLRIATAANVVGVLFVYYVIHVVSESHWLGIALTYFPRMLYPLPALVLTFVSWRWSRRLAAVNLLLVWLTVGPIMELRYGGLFGGEPSEKAVSVLSCNVQHYEPNFADVHLEILSLQPDIVALQEASVHNAPPGELFPGWNEGRFLQFRVFSKYPIKELTNTPIKTPLSRWPLHCLAGFEIQLETGSFYLFSLHQSTPRHELATMSIETILNGESRMLINNRLRYRDEEARAIRERIDQLRGDRPYLVVGDFNAPSSSTFFHAHWGDLQNAFDQTGTGYGYTANCETESHWPTGYPWARVDHILGSPEIRFERCIVGESNGSDHRLIMAWMKLADVAE